MRAGGSRRGQLVASKLLHAIAAPASRTQESNHQVGHMAFGARHSRAQILGASALSIALMFSTSAVTQTADADRKTEQKKSKQAKRKPAQAQQDAQAPSA